MNYARDIEVRQMIRDRIERLERIAITQRREREKYEAAKQIQLTLFPRTWRA